MVEKFAMVICTLYVHITMEQFRDINSGSMVICTYSVHITMANFSTVFTSKTYSGIAPLAPQVRKDIMSCHVIYVPNCHVMSCHVMSCHVRKDIQ